MVLSPVRKALRPLPTGRTLISCRAGWAADAAWLIRPDLGSRSAPGVRTMDEKRRALVVAIDRYDDPRLQRLAAPAADAAALAEVLADDDRGGFDVQVLHNAASHEVTRQVDDLLRNSPAQALILVHFSCHGIKDDTGELYLAACNTDFELLASTAVSALWMARQMRRSRARRIVLLLDCCYGGAFHKGFVARAAPDMHPVDQFDQSNLGGARGHVIITASSAMEFAFEGHSLNSSMPPAPSLFTEAFTEGIRTGLADRDEDGYVSLDELYDYVYNQVKSRTPHQTPEYSAIGQQGQLRIARSDRRRVVPTPVPDELLEAARHRTTWSRLGAVDGLARIAGSADLAAAAGAVIQLRELASDDSRQVSAKAEAAIRELQLRDKHGAALRLEIPADGDTASIELVGSPIALASNVTHTTPPFRARMAGHTLIVSATDSSAGPGTIELGSAVGNVVVHVARSQPPDREPTPPPQQTPGTATASQQPQRTLQPGATPTPPESSQTPPLPQATSPASRPAWRAETSLVGQAGGSDSQLRLYLDQAHLIVARGGLGREVLEVDGVEVAGSWIWVRGGHTFQVTDVGTPRTVTLYLALRIRGEGTYLFRDLTVDGQPIPITEATEPR